VGVGVNGQPDGAVRVVVADDTDGVRELVCLLLGMEADFEVVGQARDGDEAVRVVADTCPDLVLLDVAMPVLDGLTALPRVRAAVPAARVVMFTGSAHNGLAHEVAARGGDAVLEKSVGVASLAARLRDLCSGPRRGLPATG
jgi:DNA-binding NarL/FixJ family response regulator